jgi:hypothetical protein
MLMDTDLQGKPRTRRMKPTKPTTPGGFVHPGLTTGQGLPVEIVVKAPAGFGACYTIQGPTYAAMDRSAFKAYVARLVEML